MEVSEIMLNFAVAKANDAAAKIFGVMLEWLKRHAWKACIRQKRIPSSNLGHSASFQGSRHIFGEMAEWSIAAVLKTVEGNTSGGSNPSLSAIKPENSGFCCINTSVPSRKKLAQQLL